MYIGISLGVTAGVALSYLFLTKRGSEYRSQLADRLKDWLGHRAADFIDKKTIIPKKAAKSLPMQRFISDC